MNLSPLFEPFELGGVTIPNRFVMAPMQKHEPPDNIPTQEMVDYYRERVEGGIGLVMTQGVTLDHPTSTSPYAGFFPAAYDGWKRCVDAVRDAGGHIFPQLWHEGANRPGGYGASGLSGWGEKTGHALTRQQIAELIELYAKSAHDAKELGFSGVEIHGAHGYMVDQFFYDLTNQRDDEYGGSPENRLRFGCDIIRAVRSAVGAGFPISLRVSQWKNRNYDAKPHSTPEMLKDFLSPLKDAGVDVFHASARKFWVPEFEGSDMGYAGWVKRQSGLPVIAVGSVGLDTDLASSFQGSVARAGGKENLEEVLRRFNRGDFDLVAVGRAVLTDPQWVRKVRDSRFEEMKSSISVGDITGDLKLQLPKS